MQAPPAIDYDHGISAIDSGMARPWHVAVHWIVPDGRAAVVDVATSAAVPRILAALAVRSVAPEAVDYVVLTHIHLDHAGGAGALMRALPNATLTVHPRGARHMADPGRLIAGATAVYGAEHVAAEYGEILAVPAERILETPEGASIQLAGRTLCFLDSPGHARHHVCVHDAAANAVFTGDTFGLAYRSMDADGRRPVFPTTSPVQFDPDALHRSIDRIAALAPATAYATHFGDIGDVAARARDLHRLIDAHVAIARACAGAGPARHDLLVEGIRALLLREAREQRWRCDQAALAELFAVDIELNAQGLEVWLDSNAP